MRVACKPHKDAKMAIEGERLRLRADRSMRGRRMKEAGRYNALGEDKGPGRVRSGASGWDRTSNPCLRRAVLYPLSYRRICGILPQSGH
jgi:hypothetical protein